MSSQPSRSARRGGGLVAEVAAHQRRAPHPDPAQPALLQLLAARVRGAATLDPGHGPPHRDHLAVAGRHLAVARQADRVDLPAPWARRPGREKVTASAASERP